MVLANALNTFFIKDKPVFSNALRSLLKDPPDCSALQNWVLDNHILADKLFAKALRSLKTCLLVY